MTRPIRRFVAWLGILGIVFAQFAVTAHASINHAATVPSYAAESPAPEIDGHCTGHQPAAAITPHGNACEVQCTDGAPAADAPDLPPVVFAALTIAPALPAPVVRGSDWDRSFLAATGAAPPLALQFCRLVI